MRHHHGRLARCRLELDLHRRPGSARILPDQPDRLPRRHALHVGGVPVPVREGAARLQVEDVLRPEPCVEGLAGRPHLPALPGRGLHRLRCADGVALPPSVPLDDPLVALVLDLERRGPPGVDLQLAEEVAADLPPALRRAAEGVEDLPPFGETLPGLLHHVLVRHVLLGAERHLHRGSSLSGPFNGIGRDFKPARPAATTRRLPWSRDSRPADSR